MSWYSVFRLFSTLIDLILIKRLPAHEEEIEILLLRQRLALLERRQNNRIKLTKSKKLTLTVLTVKQKTASRRTVRRLSDSLRLVKPETVLLKTIYVLFFIEIGTRQVHLAGCTAHPTSVWVVQQAPQLIWALSDQARPMRFLIHDRDSKFTTAFNAVFQAERASILLTTYRAPNANAFAERRVRTVREECLNQILIVNGAHLRRVSKE